MKEERLLSTQQLRERESTMTHQTPEPEKINRLDPAWAMFAAAYLSWDSANVTSCADFADAMIRERDRRDREETT